LSGGTLSTTNVYVGKSGNGNFVQSGGINSTGTLLLADSAGSAGSYTESGGLTTSDYEYIGESGPGIVTQTGGTNACGILMGLGTTGSDTGTYNLSGTGSLNVGGSGCAMFNGTFNQSGGIFTCTSYLNIGLGGTATYNLSGNGSLVAGNETIGRFGTGTLAQSGGVNSSMNIYEFAGGTYTLSAGSATLASNVYINGSYSQTGGSLTDSGSVVVGAFDVGPYPLQEFEPTGTGTLAVDGGNMNIVGSLDIFTQVNLEGGTLSVGALNTAGSPAYSVNPSDFLGNGTTTGWTGGTLTITGTNGFGVGTGGELGSSLTLSTGRTLDVVGILSNSGTLTLSGGSATVGSIAGSGTTTIGSGSTLQIAPHGPASSQSALTITGTGVMNITDNMMVINYGTNNPSPVSTIGGYIKTGYNGGSWNGPGIVSSEVAAVNAAHGDSHLYAVGYADASDPAVAVDHFTPGTVVIEPAIVGDANLDGVVNFTDFQLLAASFNQPNTSWDQGDFNYAGKTNFADFQLLAANFNDSTSLDAAEFDAMNTVALSHGQTLVANPDGDGFSFVAVPEPGVVAMLGIAGLGMLRRRRRI
jgi:hypothetical protein